jgi:hypothetical protein
VRDNFSKQTIAEIAKGVGYRCSNPDCARPTIGANAAQDGTINVGVAAHITAASQGGPRYDAALSSAERSGKNNGIWLCQNCGKLVDSDPDKFTVELISEWKRGAQNRAFRELIAPHGPVQTEEAARVESIIVAENTSAPDSEFETLFAKVHAAASADVSAHKRSPIWSGSGVELTLRLYDDDNVPAFSISELPLAVQIAPEVTIIAPPGTGKTTTLLQFAGHVLDEKVIVPVYFGLGDWSADSSTLLGSLRKRLAFRSVSEEDFIELAGRGRLLLLLDGWNELAPTARSRLRIEIDRFRREFPNIRIVATTRRQVLDVPISGPRIAVETLSEEQQLQIARARLGASGEKIVDDAWRTPGVRELIAIPLYLATLLTGSSGGAKPTTKEEVLRLFVRQHERAADHAEALLLALAGRHKEVLTALAVNLNAAASTTMTDVDARRIVTRELQRLHEQGQILTPIEPQAVLDVLTNHHVLMRSGSDDAVISFQHQQFQEWYGAYEVERLMLASARGDLSARVRLRVEVIDLPAWEESILFAVERMSRDPESIAAVSHSVRLALPIDPMLSADMIYRSASKVWDTVQADILAFAKRWHSEGAVDRAVRFMIMTGRPEFADTVWPLASSTDSQIQLPTLRTAPRFRPSVLGPDITNKIKALPEKTREHLLALIASESSVDGMDLATELAKADPSPKIQAEVVQYLQFRRADRHVADLLRSALDETWVLVARKGYADEIRDPEAATRLQAELDKALRETNGPLERLRLLLEQDPGVQDRDENIARAIADVRFPVNDQQGGTSLYFVKQRAPAALLEGLRRRLEAGLQLPFHARDMLEKLEVVDDGPIAEMVLDVGSENREADAASGIVGSKTVGTLLDKFLAVTKAMKESRDDQRLTAEYHRIERRIAATREDSFISALVTRADRDDPAVVSSLASLISWHGESAGRKPQLLVEPSLKPQLISILRNWVEVVTESPNGTRYHLCSVANAIGRLGYVELVPELKRLLEEDLTRLQKARDGFMDAQRRGDITATSDARTLYGNQYQDAFSRVGGNGVATIAAGYSENRLFGFEAALILKSISDKEMNLPEPDAFWRWPNFGDVVTARAERTKSVPSPPANTLAASIFAAIDRLAARESDNEGQLLAIKLGRIGLSMPHGNCDAQVAALLALKQPIGSKREFFAALALDGRVLDVGLVMQGVDGWVDETSKKAWRDPQDAWQIEPWLELLPFTTRPEAVIPALSKVKAVYGRNYPYRFERVLAAVASLPGPEGDALLRDLARTHKDIAGDYEWMKAVLGRNSATAVLLYIDLVAEDVLGTGPQAVSTWHMGRELAPFLSKYPELKGDLRKRYEATETGPIRDVLEHLFAELGEPDDFIAMVKKYVAGGQTYDGRMSAAVRGVALRHEPIPGREDTFNIHPASVAHVRRFLFNLLRGTPQEAELAKKCLTEIDVLRDEYGIAENDPRHPDVQSGNPWPTEAG